MDIKCYTLKEAAELLGMTKPGIRYHLKALAETIEKDDKGQIIVPESILQRIRDNMKPESKVESKPESGKLLSESEPESKPESKPESGKYFPESEEKLPQKPESIVESDQESGKYFPESDRKAESAEAVALEILREQIAIKDAQIAQLSAQLEVKDRQIERKDEQLGKLTEALAAAQRTAEGSQALHAATVKQLQAAQPAVSTVTQENDAQNMDQGEKKEKSEDRRWFIPDDEDPPLQKRKKRSFLDWLLGRD